MTTQIENTQSEPPAVAGGLTQTAATAENAQNASSPQGEVLNSPYLQPPATAGGSDMARLLAENEQLELRRLTGR